MSSNRKAIRHAIATWMTANVPSAQVTYDHLPTTFDGQSPVITMGSAGSERSPMTVVGSQATFTLDVYTFVLCGTDDGTWTQGQAEDALDDVESEIAALIDVRPAPAGKKITYASATKPIFVMVDGKEYKREHIPLAVQVYQ